MMKTYETKDLYEGLLTKDHKTQGLFRCFQVSSNHSVFKTVSSRKDREGKCCTTKMEGHVLSTDSAIQVLSHRPCVLLSLLLSLSLRIHVLRKGFWMSSVLVDRVWIHSTQACSGHLTESYKTCRAGIVNLPSTLTL